MSDDKTTDKKTEHIVATAKALFLKKGFAATTMRDIADHARASKETIYNRFSSKEALIEHVLTQACRDAFPERPMEGDPKGALTAAAEDALHTLFRSDFLKLVEAAIGVKTTHPQALHLIWRDGVSRLGAYADLTSGEAAPTETSSTAHAQNFVTSLIAPFFAAAIFETAPPPSEAQIRDAVKTAVDAFFASLA